MEEIHFIGGGRRFFGGGAGGGDRRLRPHHHPPNHQALKCPRCDSLNTKFCYYNNYNLSQPRHFCKNCRRYWTKGGVLRNVPVGGGCRKSKRSNKPKNSSSLETTTATTGTTEPPPPPHEPERNKSNSHSSSESSSLTAVTAAAAAATTEVSAAPASNSALLIHQSTNPAGFELELGGGGRECGIFSEIGSFTNLITCSSSTNGNEALSFGFGDNIHDASPFRFSAQQGTDPSTHAQCPWQHQQKMMSINNNGDHTHHLDLKFPDITGSLLDHTVPVVGRGGFGSLDWHGGADQGLFDLPNAVDQPNYWTHTHWSDQDNPTSTLFHLP